MKSHPATVAINPHRLSLSPLIAKQQNTINIECPFNIHVLLVFPPTGSTCHFFWGGGALYVTIYVHFFARGLPAWYERRCGRGQFGCSHGLSGTVALRHGLILHGSLVKSMGPVDPMISKTWRFNAYCIDWVVHPPSNSGK